MKRLMAGMTAALLAVILLFSFPAHAISAESAIMIDAPTGRVLYSKNEDRRSLIASTTKIMTCLIVCEQCNVLDRIKIPKDAVGIEGSSMYLREGEIYTVQELLYGLMLCSGNDAAAALAIYCGGTLEGFAQMMNDKARSLGMLNTHFENPHGLDSQNHYSTAADLGKLAIYAMDNPVFAQIVSTKSIRIGTRTLQNHNKLLWQLEGVDGVKTGYTKAAGRILVSSAVRNGRRLVAVTISAPDDWQDHRMLLESGFQQYSLRWIVESGQSLGTLEVAGGDDCMVELLSDETFCYPLCSDDMVAVQLPAHGFVYAPVVEGQKAGKAQIYLNGCKIGEVSLIYGQTIEQNENVKPRIWEKILGGRYQ